MCLQCFDYRPAEIVQAAIASIKANNENEARIIATAETLQEVFLGALGLTGRWIQQGDRVVDKEAFYANHENDGEYVSGSEPELNLQDSTVSTVVLEQEEENGGETLSKAFRFLR